MNRRKNIVVGMLILTLLCGMKPTIAYAKSVWGGHLIQTTDYHDEYCGALRLGLLETVALQEADVDSVAQKVAPCIVRIHCGDSVGSGIVVALTEENVVLVSNTHLLQNSASCDVDFYQGFSADGEVVAYSEQYDMAFAKVPLQNIPIQQWENLRYANQNVDEDLLQDGDAVVQVGSSREPAGDYYIGGILEKKKYVPDYGMEMMKTGCQAYVGMSGGGVFDNRGHLIGMITAGDMTQETRRDGTDTTYAIGIDVIREMMYFVISSL